nr:MAG TPA: hypothetical protein [Caudoviricetes sp.]
MNICCFCRTSGRKRRTSSTACCSSFRNLPPGRCRLSLLSYSTGASTSAPGSGWGCASRVQRW